MEKIGGRGGQHASHSNATEVGAGVDGKNREASVDNTHHTETQPKQRLASMERIGGVRGDSTHHVL